jgi:hypothetical protein
MSSTMTTLPYGWTISSRLAGCWRIDDDHTLELAPLERTGDQRIRWSYRLARKGRTIFTGSGLRSGARDALDTGAYVRAAVAVLNFLTSGPGESETYTGRQRSWCEAHAEYLSIYAADEFCGYCGGEDHRSPECRSR